MGASALEFRFRYLLHAIVLAVGFWAPWERRLGSPGGGGSLWLTAAAEMARSGWMSFSAATILLLALGICLAAAGAALRTWASAYLGASIVADGAMHLESVVSDGPYRHMRNPLYFGTMLHALALGLLMPPTGALFALVALSVMQLRLIAGEEAFLRQTPSAAYEAYRSAVPRIVPSLRAGTGSAGTTPHWGQAVLGESYMIGVALSFAIFGWRYNAFLLMKCALISLGVSLIARAFLPELSRSKREPPAMDAEA